MKADICDLEAMGSVFTAVIDAPVVESPPPRAGATPGRSGASADQSVDLNGRKVLVVDDGETNRKLVGLILKRAEERR